jgi:CRISPR type I-E-associated protein CasB/Cse2
METDTQHIFLKQLKRLIDDTEGRNNRGNRAALRRYWSPTTRPQAFPMLGQLGALTDDRKAILTALYAEHPEHQEGQYLGKAALKLGDRKDGNHPYDHHFRRLLACDSLDDLAQQLHRLVKRLQREGIALDYAELHKNLNFWANYSESVKVRWAADFWQAPMAQIQTEDAAT